jgi:protein farnesyltransferase subunit beta
LQRERHVAYLRRTLFQPLPTAMLSLDASRVWLVYWCVHGLALLGERLSADETRRVAGFLGRCQHPAGGFGGGPGQLAHLAPTFAAVNALVTLAHPDALALIDRSARLRTASSLSLR